MSVDKCPCIFLCEMETIVYIFSSQRETIVFIILQIFFATRTVLKIEEYPLIFPSFKWGIFGHMMRLDQLRASENI